MWEVITTDVADEWFDSLDDINREDVLAGLIPYIWKSLITR